MNLQTEALAKQAAEYAIEFATQDQALYIPKLMEKFAELIVRECVNRVKSKADRWGTMTDEIINECVLDCAKDLREHFGVEEWTNK